MCLAVVWCPSNPFLWCCVAADPSVASTQAWYTAFVVTNIVLANGGGGSLYLPGQFATFTPADIEARVQFSKIEFASEQVNPKWVGPSKTLS